MIEEKLKVGRYIHLLTPNAVVQPTTTHRFSTQTALALHIARSTQASVLDPKESQITPGTIGQANRDFIWLCYRPGVITQVAPAGQDVLTGPMSGCWIVTYTEAGIRYVAHIGSVAGAQDPDTVGVKNAWNAFALTRQGNNLAGFNPARDLGPTLPTRKSDDGPPNILGLVTTNNEFYTVFTYASGAGRWRIAAVKEVASTLPTAGQLAF